MLVYAREGISGSLDKNTWMMRRDPGWAADMRVTNTERQLEVGMCSLL